jgi:hypothetical protein
MPTRSKRTKVICHVDEATRWEWEKRFGGYASVGWLLETAMRSTLDDTKDQPTLEEAVRRSIRAHITKYHRGFEGKKDVSITASA